MPAQQDHAAHAASDATAAAHVRPLELRRSWIDGAGWTEAVGVLAHRNPANGADIGDSEIVDARAVDLAVAAARRSFVHRWGRTPLNVRHRQLSDFAALVEANAAKLAMLETLEVGRPFGDAATLISQGSELIRRYAALADAVHGDVVTNEARQFGACWRRPRGVVAAIVPWNFPVMNVLARLAPALAAGNTVVLKPSEYAPASAVLLAQLASEAGLPDGAFNVVLGGAGVGRALASHSDVDLVAFTGSTASGLAVARAAAEASLKPVLLECGGKSPQIVLDDCIDDPGIWPQIFFSAFWNTGQWCAAKTRLLAPRARLDAALSGLQAAARQWRVGDPADAGTALGPLVNRTQFDRVAGYLAAASSAGSVVELDCTRGELDSQGLYAIPSVALDQPPAGKVVREEVFGPLLTLEAFDDFDEAIRSANATDYGLMAAIWTNRADLGQRFAREVHAGGLTIYSSSAAAATYVPDFVSAYLEPQKASGIGVDGGAPGLLAYTTSQSITWVS